MHLSFLTSSVKTDGLFLSPSKPFYYVDRPCWHPHISDKALVLLAPVLTYWSIFLLYHFFLLIHFPHASSRRRPRKIQAVQLVVEIQIVQTFFAWVWLTRYSHESGPLDSAGEMRAMARALGSALSGFMGPAHAQEFLDEKGESLVQFAYWWAIPVARQFLASFAVDAWQGLLYLFRIDRYLYPDVHAFLFNTLGAFFAYSLSGITNREAVVFLILLTLESFGQLPRPMLPESSIHPRISLERERTLKPVENVPFTGFRRQLHHLFLVHWYMLLGDPLVNMHAVESRRIQRAMNVARHQQTAGGQHTRPQLHLDMTCL